MSIGGFVCRLQMTTLVKLRISFALRASASVQTLKALNHKARDSLVLTVFVLGGQ
jgi:hypothetical protein